MKIHCDVCNQNEASVYCTADEAALCSACDHRVHHANKLAGKHPRLTLRRPSPEDSAVCDICQEKKAFLFCQQDRAILCRDCDANIHKVNQHTMNHHRFVLTGVKLGPYSPETPPTAVPPTTKNGVVPDQRPIMNPALDCHQELKGSGQGVTSATSSISEYLIEMLPGWHVEDFLDPPSNPSKVCDKDPAPIWGCDLLEGSLSSSLSPESMGIWVPQAPATAAGYSFQQLEPSSNMGFGGQISNGSPFLFGPNDQSNLTKIGNGVKSGRKWPLDNGNCFTVPQISPPGRNFKRSRTVWQ